MNARYFDVNNYLITATDIRGPWSEPVFLHSSGFDASILHDNGKKYIVSLNGRPGKATKSLVQSVWWNTIRKKKEIIGYPKRIWNGGTGRGCIEAPHLYKRENIITSCGRRGNRL